VIAGAGRQPCSLGLQSGNGVVEAGELGSERDEDLPAVHRRGVDRAQEAAQRERAAQGLAAKPNETWSMDFVAQRLAGALGPGIDANGPGQFTRECLSL
jgi:hypothetical protein